MAIEAERLIIDMEARVNKLEKELQKARDSANRQFNAIEQRTQKAGKRMEDSVASSAKRINSSLSTIGKGALGGIAAALTINGLNQVVGQYRAVATSVANIGNEARRAGLSTKAFQELSFVASQTRIPMDALIDGMKELNLRADEFVATGAGSAAEAFRRIGFDAKTLSKALEDPSALLVEIVARMKKLNTAAQIRVADELFGGTGGEQFVELLRHGEAGIKTMIKEANAFGLVMDDAFIAKADEVDRKFDLLTKTIGVGLKGAILDATEALGTFLDSFRDIQNQQIGTLVANRDLAIRTRDAAQRKIDEGATFDFMLEPFRRQVEKSQAEITELDKAIAIRSGQTGDAIERLGSAAENAAGKLSGITPPGTSARAAETASMAALGRFNDTEARTVASRGMLDLIGYAEGTDKGRKYNETLAYGKFTGGDVNLTQMTLNEVLALQKRMLAHPDNSYNSSAVGRYQIVSKTLRGLMKEMGLTGGEFFDAGMQDRMAQQLLRRRGNDKAGLRNEWEGLRRVPDGAISNAMGETSQTMPGRDEAVQARIDKNKELATSYQEIVDGAVASIAAGNVEEKTLGMTKEAANRYRIEQELLNQAAARGIALSPEQRKQLTDLAAGMAEVENAAAKAEENASFQKIVADGAAYIVQLQTEAEARYLTAEAAAALRYEQELLNQAQSAGITLSQAQKDQLTLLAQGMADAETSADKLARSQEQLSGLAKDAFKGFAQDLMEGKSAAEAFEGVLGRIADKLLDMAVDGLFDSLFSGGGKGGGGGGFLSIISGLFGGGRAKGGSVSGSKYYMVGEKGPELFAPGKSGTIIPNHNLSAPRVGASPAANQSVQLSVINNTGVQADVSTQKNPDGSISVMLDKAVARNLNTRGTSTNNALRQRFGARERLGSR